jgi:predicted ester cyclase
LLHLASLPELGEATRLCGLGECSDLEIRICTHQGEFQGIPATGRTIGYVRHEFHRAADGLVVEEWICSDLGSLFSHLS